MEGAVWIVSAEGTVGTAGWQRMPAGGVLTGLRCVHSETERLTKKILHFVQNDSLVSFRGR